MTCVTCLDTLSLRETLQARTTATLSATKISVQAAWATDNERTTTRSGCRQHGGTFSRWVLRTAKGFMTEMSQSSPEPPSLKTTIGMRAVGLLSTCAHTHRSHNDKVPSQTRNKKMSRQCLPKTILYRRIDPTHDGESTESASERIQNISSSHPVRLGGHRDA